MEDLLRGLLDLPQRPAVLIARTIGLEADVSRRLVPSLYNLSLLPSPLLLHPRALMLTTPSLCSLQMIAVGGDEHLSVGTYYDVPVISLRPVLLPLLIKQPERDAEYFVRTNEGNIDHRHINAKGESSSRASTRRSPMRRKLISFAFPFFARRLFRSSRSRRLHRVLRSGSVRRRYSPTQGLASFGTRGLEAAVWEAEGGRARLAWT